MSDENITTWPERISLYQGENGEPIHYIRTDLVKPMTVEKAREILLDNYVESELKEFTNTETVILGDNSIFNPIFTAEELEAIAFLMRTKG